MRIRLTIALLLLTSLTVMAQPRLVRKAGDCASIQVNGTEMLIIGGELGNSSATTLEDCQRIFPKLKRMGLNTVLAPAYWELVEPQEGQYDWSSVDNVIIEARKNGLKVVFLWFGVWKNSMSCYAPEWFKRDTKRFPRAQAYGGKPVEEASSLSRNVLEADKRVFCKLVQHIKDIDSDEQTVIMMQVENEIGMIEVPRDYSPDATKLYQNGLGKNVKTPWTPGKELSEQDIYNEERFQAYTYAVYVEEIAKAARSIYDLPMYVNVALNSRGRKPGQYPSGGPLAHLSDIWKEYAPSIDIMGLDLYDSGFKDWTDKYHFEGNPLFIPEIRLEEVDAARALYAFGHHSVLGFCPFSIEDYVPANQLGKAALSAEDLAKDDQVNAYSGRISQGDGSLPAVYRMLRQLEPLIIKNQGTDNMYGVLLDNENRQCQITTADGITLTIKHSLSLGWEGSREIWPEVACLIIRQGPEDYIIAGTGVVVTYSDSKASGVWKKGDSRIGLAKCETIEYQDGVAKIIRHLSGDQTHQGRHVRISTDDYQIQHFRLYRY